MEPPATWKRSPFGPLQGDIKRSFHVFQPLSSFTIHAEHTCHLRPVRSGDIPRHLHHLPSLQPSREVFRLPRPSRSPVEEPAALCRPCYFLSRIIVVLNIRYSSKLLNYSAGVNCRYSETYRLVKPAEVHQKAF